MAIVLDTSVVVAFMNRREAAHRGGCVRVAVRRYVILAAGALMLISAVFVQARRPVGRAFELVRMGHP